MGWIARKVDSLLIEILLCQGHRGHGGGLTGVLEMQRWWAQLDSNQRPRDYEFAFKTISY